ncbi:hypothetical protein Kpol_449p13 [Vanderwaltozyma polyspora DSM 70294]|uniref:Phosphoinositide phospholipase C n=1 Tax=Vanderwaltozyma polyspora (strain ATCC 22028 / DSM 70294 / BCRC 21397 / CBS 2163 / NBRC 10782 / NRRL Y-8283 / UCD 57-17) TaxID=436907 RepID=A7TR21_VANPO|nr:uncharacterized protein Kpol_449p13 [Vanderwaltozyma polyspora DSM 70294]EDO15296.1 hypothetical protein Kpol_449p13 [Vanderwaltozyma polyspora DSM 70294]
MIPLIRRLQYEEDTDNKQITRSSSNEVIGQEEYNYAVTFKDSKVTSIEVGVSRSRSLKGIVKRTSDLVCFSRSSNIKADIGPLTTSRSMKYFLNYDLKRNVLPLELKDACDELRKGLSMIRVTRRKKVAHIFKLNGTDSIKWNNNEKSLEIDSIKDIRVDTLAINYRKEYNIPDSSSNLWITVIFEVSKKLKALHLIANKHTDFQTFCTCIGGLVKYRYDLMKSVSVPESEKFANIHWHSSVSEKKEDESKDTLSFVDIKRLCDKFHIYCSSKHLLKFFTAADINHNGLLNFKEFQTFVQLLKRRDEIIKVWESLTNCRQYLNLDEFHEFVTKIQKEKEDKASIFTIYNKFKSPDKKYMDLNGFINYLSSQPYINDDVVDYSKPLNHYYIASSHNTYLLGKQFGETPSVEGYIQVLQQGCRCVEIDIWDDENGPVVCHSFLTSSIPLLDVASVIRKYAFITSPYPLIISLETNCNKINQLKAVSIFKDIFGDSLCTNILDGDALASPESLKLKVILKIKKTKRLDDIDNSKSSLSLSSSSFESTGSSHGSSFESEYEATSFYDPENKTSKLSSMGIRRRIRRMSMKKQVHIIDELSEIAGIQGLKFRNFSLPESKTRIHCFSLNEKKLEHLCKDTTQKLAVDKHNRRFLMRIYPHALRYKSSNFDPIKCWEIGTQMVATNWQTNDLGHQLNLALFKLTDQKQELLHTGYALKPPKLLPEVTKSRDLTQLYKETKKDPVTVCITLLSGQLLPKPKNIKSNEDTFAPYVVTEFICNCEPVKPLMVKFGTALSPKVCSTPRCKENGFSPTWNTEMCITLKDIELAFVKFTVKTEESILASCTLKLDYIRKGYRHIPLYNPKGEKYIFSTLFINTRA